MLLSHRNKQMLDKIKIYKKFKTNYKNLKRSKAYDMQYILPLSLPGHASSVSVLRTALCWAQKWTKSSNVPTVVFVLTVAAVRGEAQVGRRRQMFCAAVDLKKKNRHRVW